MDGIHRCNRCIASLGKIAELRAWDGAETHPMILLILCSSMLGLTLYFLGLSAVLWP